MQAFKNDRVRHITKKYWPLLVLLIALAGHFLYKRFRLAHPSAYPPYMKTVLYTGKTVQLKDGQRMGSYGELTVHTFRNGSFLLGDKLGVLQTSPSYRDSAFIRSTKPLPSTYTVRATVGEINYELDYVNRLAKDPEYAEGPRGENGCYLLTIVDMMPNNHHTNDWWHQHRKVAIDVDNNHWGAGMPHPLFMVAFDRKNQMKSYDGISNLWTNEWKRAIQYQPNRWYEVEIRKTVDEYILSIRNIDGLLLEQAHYPIEQVWHPEMPDYFVIGEPHENYYQGSMRIHAIEILRGEQD